IATMLHFQKGTPYVYQGEELGMTNCPFGPIENYRDIESLNAYRELTESGVREASELLDCIAYKGRDNARTPVQWDDSPNAGFTTGVPWIMVNPNYREINAAAQVDDPDSVFSYYRRLIALRRGSEWKDLIVYGAYRLIAPDDPDIYAYVRELDGKRLLVVCNLSGKAREFAPELSPAPVEAQLLTSNVGNPAFSPVLRLSPWEADAWEVR
ncbi:MAG: alpha-glucosidase C-terminal domain-containing protein, partial [Oscillibacter sp.]|nr:alpha-glucosidase C-terminal domain-containing protein [Oscillibacter sp.]